MMQRTGSAGVSRREFLARAGQGAIAIGGLAVAASSAARVLQGQEAGAPQSSASNVEMSADAYKPVRLPAKAGAQPQMTPAALNEFEKGLACPCPCTQDVYTCRMTDFSCGISPQVHDDIAALVKGGYSADEIMKAMTDTYGDFILMEPRKRGFNLLAWFAPFAALGVGAVGIGALLRGWRRNARSADVARGTPERLDPSVRGTIRSDDVPDATDAELARLEAALRDGGQ